MDGHSELARDYRQRAKEVRVVLRDVKDDLARTTLEKIADSYDHLATIHEGLAKAGP